MQWKQSKPFKLPFKFFEIFEINNNFFLATKQFVASQQSDLNNYLFCPLINNKFTPQELTKLKT